MNFGNFIKTFEKFVGRTATSTEHQVLYFICFGDDVNHEFLHDGIEREIAELVRQKKDELKNIYEKISVWGKSTLYEIQIYSESGYLKIVEAKLLRKWDLIKSISKINESIVIYNRIKHLLGERLADVEKSKLSKYFIEYHIIPMVAAIWSMPFKKAKDMPLKLFLNFFINHGLFKLKNRPQWYTVTNRSRAYVNKVLEKLSNS